MLPSKEHMSTFYAGQHYAQSWSKYDKSLLESLPSRFDQLRTHEISSFVC